ncbi:MAG: hypothetical protein KGR18_11160, partial [Acidobacteria bacterium]|nr:hypothetical protein [Acidobacteriota bacterium]
MPRSILQRPARRPLAIASAIALTAAVALTFAPTANAAAPSVSCEDANLDKLAKATGGNLSTLETGGMCYVLHTFSSAIAPATISPGFSSSDTFTVTSSSPLDVEYLVVGGGGGGGAGGTWTNT